MPGEHGNLLHAGEEKDKLSVEAVEMEAQKVYNRLRNLWHNAMAQKDTRLVLAEDFEKDAHRSGVLTLMAEPIRAVKAFGK